MSRHFLHAHTAIHHPLRRINLVHNKCKNSFHVFLPPFPLAPPAQISTIQESNFSGRFLSPSKVHCSLFFSVPRPSSIYTLAFFIDIHDTAKLFARVVKNSRRTFSLFSSLLFPRYSLSQRSDFARVQRNQGLPGKRVRFYICVYV